MRFAVVEYEIFSCPFQFAIGIILLFLEFLLELISILFVLDLFHPIPSFCECLNEPDIVIIITILWSMRTKTKVIVAKSIFNVNKQGACWKRLRYTVFVKFNPAGKIIVYGDQITISLKSKPERGRANVELIRKLADYFGVGKDKIRIISGRTSNKKLVEVDT